MKRHFLLLNIILAFNILNAQETYRFRTDKPQGFSIESSTATGLSLHYAISELDIARIDNGEAQGQEIILKGSFGSFAEGMPNLPFENRYIAVPKGATVSIEVKEKGCQTLSGIEILPAAAVQGNAAVGMPKLEKDMSVFGKDANYPSENVSIAQTTQIRGLDVVLLNVTPFRYNPVRKTLEVVYDMDIEVRFEGGNGQFGEARYRNPDWDGILRDLVINSNMLSETHYYDYLNEAIQNGEEGCEYLIIALDADSILAWADTLRDFRTKQGILTKVVTTTECGGNDPETIKNYIKNAYDNWTIPPAALMLFGAFQDTLYYMEDYYVQGLGLPAFYLFFKDYDYGGGNIQSFNYYSDNPYADMNGDSIPDMAISRMPGITVKDCQVQIEKLIRYETTPPTDAYYYDRPILSSGFEDNKWFMISSQSINGFFTNKLGKHPYNFYMWYDGEENNLIPPDSIWSTGYNTDAVLDYFGPDGQNYFPRSLSELDNWRSRIENDYLASALNSGSFFTFYRDHSMSSGWACPYFYSDDVKMLRNTVPTFLLSVGCDTGCFEETVYNFQGYVSPFYETNLISTFCKEETGALGGIGATTVTRSHFNDILTWGIIDNLWHSFMPDMGTMTQPQFTRPAYALVAGKLFLNEHAFMPAWWPSYIFDTENVFHHLGETYLNLYTEVPQHMAINADVFTNDQSHYTMTAEAGATICLTHDDDILVVATATGQPQDFIFPNLPIDEWITVTVTKQNRFLFEKAVRVISNTLPFVYVKDTDIKDQNGNGQLDYGEYANIDLTLNNHSEIASLGGEITLHSDSPYIEIVQGTTHYPQMGANATLNIANAFRIRLSSNVPDQTRIQLKARFNENENTHEDGINITANAPCIVINPEFRPMTADGEPSTHISTEGKSSIIFSVKNTGHSTANLIQANLDIKAPFVEVENAQIQHEGLAPYESYDFTFELNTTPNSITGAWLQSHFNVQHWGWLDTIVQYGGIFENFETDTLNPYFRWTNTGKPWQYCAENPYEGQRCLVAASDTTAYSLLKAKLRNSYVGHNCKISFYYQTDSDEPLYYYTMHPNELTEFSSTEWKYGEMLYNGTDMQMNWRYQLSDANHLQAKLDNLCFPPLHTTIAYAGNDIIVCNEEFVVLYDAYAYDCDSISWTTDGDGRFDRDTIANPFYYPGNQDIESGSVTLTLTAFGSDTIVSTTRIRFADDVSLGEIAGDSVVNKYNNPISHYSVENPEGMHHSWYLEPTEAGIIYGFGDAIDILWNQQEGDVEATLWAWADHGCKSVSKCIRLIGFSASEWHTADFDLFPNPTDSKVNLVVGETLQGKAVVEVYNLLGEQMMVKNLGHLQQGETITLDISRLASGLYIIKLSAENGSCTKKVSVK